MDGSVRGAIRAGIGAKQAVCLGFIAISWRNGNPRRKAVGNRQAGSRKGRKRRADATPALSNADLPIADCLFIVHCST